MDFQSVPTYPEYEDFPSNHAPTYNDNPMHPYLAAVSGNMDKYANAEDRARYYNHMMQQPLTNYGTHAHGAYGTGGGGGGGNGWGGDPTGSGGTGHSGYGYESPSGVGGGGGYDYYPAAPVHTPNGGSHSHHAIADSGYGVPPPPKYMPPTLPTKKSGKKKGSSSSSSSNASTLNALTLLSFFFFVNLLQSCLKENMEAMNPTVMVMTTNMARNRNTKLAEMNSREQSTSPASAFTSGANIVVQPEDLVSAAAGSSLAAAVPAVSSVKLQTSPYSDGGGGASASSASSAVNIGSNIAGSASVINSNNNQGISSDNDNRKPGEPQYSYGSNGMLKGQQHYSSDASQHQQNNDNNPHLYGAVSHAGEAAFLPTPSPAIITTNRDPRPGYYDAAHLYPNQTLVSTTNTGNEQHYNQQRPYHQEHYEQEMYEHQYPQMHHQPQPQQQQHQQQHEHNQFQQYQHYQHQHPDPSHPQDRFPQQSDHHDNFHDHHQQPSPHDHFQHHYPAQHSSHQSPFHSHQHHHHSTDRRPLRPAATHSESSHPWSYSPGFSTANKRGSSTSPLSSYTWSSSSLPDRVSGNNKFDDGDDDDDRRYDDSFYTRSNRKL